MIGRWGCRAILAAGLLAACGRRGPSTADLARVESVWQVAADSATRARCADSLAHGRSRCTTVQGADTLFIWGDSAHRAAGFIRVHPVGRPAQDSAVTALRERLATTLGAGVQCTEQVHGWSVGPASAMVVKRPDGGVVLVLGTHQQAAIVCPGIERE